ncbi:MAG: MerR family transcriptional regulator [Firmicutes bacterium]|nr:MerR family transcriptional regulator [Bacillota bacterium]
MTELIKSGDLSARYGVSTRTLRYYEEIGLIQSRRTEGYAYRMYDDANIKRLEQILILRKLNIGIKDIRRIFSTAGADVVLEVLEKKVSDIDEEVALLHELKEIVITFIRQIEQADFTKDSDVKLLYDKAKEIKTQLANPEYAGNSSPVHRLFEVTERLEEKASSRLQVPENVMKRLLQNVYFVWGDGINVANELGRKHGIYVYHTCDNRYKHTQNADPKFQPGLFRFEMNMENYFAQDPEDAMQREQEIVRDYTPMVIMDLIQLTAVHEKIICENAIDIDSIMPFVTHAVTITDSKPSAEFAKRYKNEISSLDISAEEKERRFRRVDEVWGEPKQPREVAQYGVKQIIWDDNSTVEQTADIVAEYFGLPVE